MREQSALTIHDPSFGRADATATVQDFSLGPDFTSLGRDRTHQGNLELEGGLGELLCRGSIEWPIPCSCRAASGDAAVHCPRRIKMRAGWNQRDKDTTSLSFGDVIA